MVRMMQGVITSGTGVRAGFGRTAAGKTGTSQDYRDAWFVGFTPDWIAGVWVGNDDNRPMAGMTGGKLPAAIWRRFMVAAHKGLPPSDFTWAPPLPSTSAPRWFPEDDAAPAPDPSEEPVDYAYGPDDYGPAADPVRIRNFEGPADAPPEEAWDGAQDAPPAYEDRPSPRRAWWPGYPY
jgi:membrane peptidoglycan carboxypeptidase